MRLPLEVPYSVWYFSNVINRVTTKLSIYINNDIQADIFDKIIDADWMKINQYSNGDVLNRFNGDVTTVSSNAISWLPTIIIAIYNFIATFVVIWHYDKIMSLLAFASAPVMLLMSKFLISKQREYGQKVREMSSDMMTFEVETFYNFDTIKSFGISGLYSQKMRGMAGEIQGYQSGVQYVFHQNRDFYVHYGNDCSVCGIWILSVPFVDRGYFLRNHDFVPAAEE